MPGFSNPAGFCNGHASEAQRNLEITIIIIITRHDFLALLLKMENAKHWQDRNLDISIAPIAQVAVTIVNTAAMLKQYLQASKVKSGSSSRFIGSDRYSRFFQF